MASDKVASEGTMTHDEVAKANEAFAKLTNAEKRVAIARDVIAMANTKRFDLRQGEYLDSPKMAKVGCSMRDVLRRSDVRCEVCAKGALFFAYVDRLNNVIFRYDLSPETRSFSRVSLYDFHVVQPLLTFFRPEQLDLIEAAFEGVDVQDTFEDDDETLNAIDNFADSYGDVKDRLIAIMQNIVDHGGEFRLSDRLSSAQVEPTAV